MEYFITILCLMCLIGCKVIQKSSRHFQSNLSGLKREVVLYANDGSVIKKYKGTFKVEIDGSVISFIDDNKEIKMTGTVVVEEK